MKFFDSLKKKEFDSYLVGELAELNAKPFECELLRFSPYLMQHFSSSTKCIVLIMLNNMDGATKTLEMEREIV